MRCREMSEKLSKIYEFFYMYFDIINFNWIVLNLFPNSIQKFYLFSEYSVMSVFPLLNITKKISECSSCPSQFDPWYETPRVKYKKKIGRRNEKSFHRTCKVFQLIFCIISLLEVRNVWIRVKELVILALLIAFSFFYV